MAAILTGGCTGILGVREIYLDNGAIAGDGGVDGEVPVDGNVINPETGAPLDCGGVDLKTDPKNCGRCGHDCVGAACGGGMCEPIVVADGFTSPTGLALDATSVYVTTLIGEIAKVDKDGKNRRTLTTGQTKARGIAVDGDNVYWSNGDYYYNGTDLTRRGGIWKCSQTACVPTLVVAADWAMNVKLASGFLYFAAQNAGEIRRIRPDGTGGVLIASPTRPFDVAADAVHAYYTSESNNIYRSPVTGGPTSDPVGPLNGVLIGYVAVDATRVFWTYVLADGRGRVMSVEKAILGGSTIEYGIDNVASDGIAVDDTFVYWTGNGTEAAPEVSAEDGNVRFCHKTGCLPGEPKILAEKLVFSGPMAVDATAVYWLEYGNKNQATGRLRKVAKP